MRLGIHTETEMPVINKIMELSCFYSNNLCDFMKTLRYLDN